jgi:hypothetical protein
MLSLNLGENGVGMALQKRRCRTTSEPKLPLTLNGHISADCVLYIVTSGSAALRRKFCLLRGCIQKFPDWPSGARTANGISSLPLGAVVSLLYELV